MTPEELKALTAALAANQQPQQPRGQISLDGILKFWPMLAATGLLVGWMWNLSGDIKTRDIKVDTRLEQLEKSASPEKLQDQDKRINNLERTVESMDKKLTKIEDGVATLNSMLKDVQSDPYSSRGPSRGR